MIKKVLAVSSLALPLLVLTLLAPLPRMVSNSDFDRTQYQNLSSKSVLGANSAEEQGNPCGQKPVIGWINYAGTKKIVRNLPANERPSACFESIEEAHREGFFQ
jgi:hypothetical protein